MIFIINIEKTVKKAIEYYEELKKCGEIGFCCVSDVSLIILNTILQMAKREGLDVETKIIIRDKKEG